MSLHKYAYSDGDPVNMRDPSGESPIATLSISVATLSVLVNVGFTVFSGLRHGQSAASIALNVGQNLLVFGIIAGSSLLSGLVATLATVVLAGLAIYGAIQFILAWPQMDTVDVTIAFVLFLTYGSFGIAIRPAVGLPSVFELQRLPYSAMRSARVDMRNAPIRRSTKTNTNGYPVDYQFFWQEMFSRYPHWFSPKNRAAVDVPRSRIRAPEVDSTWVRYNPGHRAFMNDKLVHHHVNQGPMATPMPESVHQAYFRTIHTNAGGRR
ncbi:hypothetical protein YTPLAS18_12480 [Nitrospira sp.]|nr:hypothetical protein YTPLAS18_12480 [Nitrospira sp.]